MNNPSPSFGAQNAQPGGISPAFDLAAKNIGLNENDQKAAISEYLKNGGQNLDPATTAWCAAFVNATLAQTGGQGTGALNARSFMKWGQEVQDPQRGDVAVFSRGDPNGWQGHVGFFEGLNEDGSIRVLGGNQGDAVSVANYPANRLLGYRRAGEPTQGIADDAMAAIGKQPMQRGTQTAIGGSGADTMDTPRQGLLGQIARPDEKVGGLLGMMFGNMSPDRADQLRANIGGMMGINNQGMVDGARGRMRSRSGARENDLNYARQQQQTEQERQREAQRTAQAEAYIAKNHPQYAEAVRTGVMTAQQAYVLANKPENETSWEVVEAPDGTQWQVDPKGVKPPQQLFAGVEAGPDTKTASDSRKEFSGLPAVKDFSSQAAAFGRIVASTKNPTAAGDMALIFNYMKLLDPGSVVRESEFEMAAASGSLDDRFDGWASRIANGERLSENVRNDFLKRAEMLYSEAERGFEGLQEQYTRNADAAGIPSGQGVTDFRYKGQNAPQTALRPQTPKQSSALPPAPDGYTAEQWRKAYDLMTPEQRKLFQ